MNPLFHVTASALAIALVALPADAGRAPPQPPVSPGTTPVTAGQASREAPPETQGGIGYANVADLVLSAPIIADATVRSTAKIKPAEAPNLAPGLVRLYVEVDVTALIRGADGLPPRIGYLLDIAPDSAGKVPKFKKARVLIFARPVAGAVNQVQLIAPDAQLDWTPTADARARKIAKDALASDAPPVITGIGNAFHVAGALPGEGETQIFLTTADQRPVSLSILRRPGEQPRWAVALSEIVDESAAPPAPETLLWYRMACALPATLPERSTGSLEAADATIAREDYAFVLAALGPCGRTRKS
ncbi:hypothetical protein C8J45_101865 [Sphingomonas sp. PP-CE-3G-477]|uniref:hypothetical protein n=1 Tax=Sphingomonas sp. PP-CE-3G-477 TaxID=2135660 RepID=UPI000D35A706|nr:hypothetical protein [Sphingomonas sp. PP-CE-3G-477]PTQ66000.1 hypothetical protein C8J45_101865 [Sphingomonas sp. PP-CE-3G-477]